MRCVGVRSCLFYGACFLVAGVHEGAASALVPEVGVVDGWAGLVCREAAGKLGVRPEFWGTAIELAGVAEDHADAAVHGLNDAANVDVGVAVFAELADIIAVFPGAEDGEVAGVVGSLGRADVQEAGAIRKLDDLIDMRVDADVLV